MIANYYTLYHVSRDLDTLLRQKSIKEFFSQNKNELILHVQPDLYVMMHCDPSSPAVFLRMSFSRAKKNTAAFFDNLAGKTISAVELSTSDREILFHLNDGHRIIAQVFTSNSNVLLVNPENRITGSFLKPRDLVGQTYQPRSPAADIQDSKALLARLSSDDDVPLTHALKKCFPQLGRELVRETLLRSQQDLDRRTGSLSTGDAESIYTEYEALLSELLEKPLPRIYYREKTPVIFSIIALREAEHLSSRLFADIHEAIRTFLAERGRDKQFATGRDDLIGRLNLEIQRSEKTLHKLGEKTRDQSQEHERTGKLILSHLSDIRKGMKSVLLQENGEETRVSLDPSLTPAKNAEKYFDRAKKSRAAIEEAESFRPELENKLGIARRLLESAEIIESSDELAEFARQNSEALGSLGIHLDKRGKKSDEQIPFRVFIVAGGFQVWAGKNSENNDLLTTRYAKPDDWWFHARGSSGSHVVLRLGTGKGEPGKQAMEQAAAIAAYYSKMKHSGLVPVAVTRRKYVRKPRGTPAGTVTIEREKIIFVGPRLPQP